METGRQVAMLLFGVLLFGALVAARPLHTSPFVELWFVASAILAISIAIVACWSWWQQPTPSDWQKIRRYQWIGRIVAAVVVVGAVVSVGLQPDRAVMPP
ncbi:MAG: hypothetical protein OXH23_09565 [bacterium]|nr:hypothetical protein [bacterium]